MNRLETLDLDPLNKSVFIKCSLERWKQKQNIRQTIFGTQFAIKYIGMHAYERRKIKNKPNNKHETFTSIFE